MEIRCFGPPKAVHGTLCSDPSLQSRARDPRGRAHRRYLEQSPDAAALARGDHPPVSAEAARRVSGRLAVVDDGVELRAGAL